MISKYFIILSLVVSGLAVAATASSDSEEIEPIGEAVGGGIMLNE